MSGFHVALISYIKVPAAKIVFFFVRAIHSMSPHFPLMKRHKSFDLGKKAKRS